ncbi:MAG: carboxy terminal-processing peptidase [Verrucomicrobiales bacterium]|nr:carboxy terminal-processing peptidase [Verrucomicrobiales bacterium]
MSIRSKSLQPLTKLRSTLLVSYFSCCAAFLLIATSKPVVAAEANFEEIGMRVAKMLAEEHYSQHPFDDKMSERTLDNYIRFLDYGRQYFTQEDIDGFYKKYRTTLDDEVKARKLEAAFEIYKIYLERVNSRVSKVKEILEKGDLDFNSDKTVHLSRKKEKWPADMAASDELWHRLIEGEMLQATLRKEILDKKKKKDAEKKAKAEAEAKKDGDAAKGEESEVAEGDKKAIAKKEKSPKEKIIKRYDRILKNVNDNDSEDIAVMFIKAITRSYDPHSEYFSQSQYDNFRISMSKSLKGIGAMLSLDEDSGAAEIQGIVVGGPAAKNGELKIKDKIVKVGQGKKGDMVDIVGEKLGDIVDKIRGEKDSYVRLEVIPADAVDPSQTKIITILRDKVDLKESLANAELIITKDAQGKEQKIGWIHLSSFYSSMGDGKTSTTVDVQRLVNRLKKEGVDGMVLDLRDNGGGSLEEAINLTGLFIPRGPVVQSKNWRGDMDEKFSRNRYALYDGPLLVLTNRASASASEILAAALQDYQRSLIIGDKATFGKGTVQQLRPVRTGRIPLPFRSQEVTNGALKLTIQTFFRISGGSTQLKGVIPDIHLPSTNNVLDFGEASLEWPLVWEKVQPEKYSIVRKTPPPVEGLSKKSAERIAKEQDFVYIREDIERTKKRIDENVISLNRQKRELEVKDLETQREQRIEERKARYARIKKDEQGLYAIYGLTQDNVDEEKLVLKSDLSTEDTTGMKTAKLEEDPEAKALEYPHGFDPYVRETLHILQDLIAAEKKNSPVGISAIK